MLVDILIPRFARHNQRFSAYMELMKAIGHQIRDAEDPASAFERYQLLLRDFLYFLENDELQHEKEEEKLVFPAFVGWNHASNSSSADDLGKDHTQGRKLIQSLRESFSRLANRDIRSPDYQDFARMLNELCVHYQAHVTRERERIQPALTRMLVADDGKVSLPESKIAARV